MRSRNPSRSFQWSGTWYRTNDIHRSFGRVVCGWPHADAGLHRWVARTSTNAEPGRSGACAAIADREHSRAAAAHTTAYHVDYISGDPPERQRGRDAGWCLR